MENIKPTIELKDVSMYYHDKNNVNVGISHISLKFYKGEFVAVTGESGSGKTSLLNVIGASIPYHDGEVYYDGEPSSHFDDEDRETFRRERIGYVCQNYNLIDSYTVIQNVMAAMIIVGISRKEAETKALKYLEIVGLKEQAYKKATKISSGQKQRLGIARALAKETDIILADEPTGNLDSENGKEIVNLLKQLSKDHLVIMVTHNIDEAIDTASRIIRISDGHVVLDEIKNQDFELLTCEKPNTIETKDIKTAWSFSMFNRSAKPKRAILLAVFLYLVTLTVFVFIGTTIVNMDDTTTKVYDNSAFLNSSKERIVLMKDDNSEILDEDIEKIYSLKYIKQVDRFDLVNDFIYVLEEKCDFNYYEIYETDANGFPIESTFENHRTPLMPTNSKNFMKSSTCITQDDLAAGKLPEKVNEIVVYGKEELIGTTIKIYFREDKFWNSTDYLCYDMVVSGVLNNHHSNEKNQIYFSERLCTEMIAAASKQYTHTMSFRFKNGVDKYGVTRWKQSHNGVYLFTDFIGENKVSVSHTFFAPSLRKPFDDKILIDQTNFSTCDGPSVRDSFSESSGGILKIDESFYDMYFSDVKSVQASIYIEDYAYTDEVLNKLNSLGYTAVSSFRVSSLVYDQDILAARNITIAVCVGSVFVIFILMLFVLVAFLNLNQNDYLLLRFIGMNKKTMYWTNFFEILITACIMFVLAIITTFVLDLFNVAIVHDIVKYMVWYQFIILFVVVFVIVWATTYRFNKTLQKKSLKKSE